jgi:hypothetical protein
VTFASRSSNPASWRGYWRVLSSQSSSSEPPPRGVMLRLGAKFDRHVQFMRCMEDTFQRDEIGGVEVPSGDTVFLLPVLLQ